MSERITEIRSAFLEDPSTSLTKLAQDYEISLTQLELVAKEEDWTSQKRSYYAQKYESQNIMFREAAVEKRLPLVMKQLEIVEKLQNIILLALEEGGLDAGSHELRRISETVTSITGTLNSLLGIKDALEVEKKDRGRNHTIFLMSGAQPIKKHELYDVTPE